MKNDGFKYSGSSFETGIILRRVKEGCEYLSVAVRAEDGEISTATKVIRGLPDDGAGGVRRFFRRRVNPSPGMGFKQAVLHHLRNNGGKIVGDIPVTHRYSVAETLFKWLLQLIMIAVFLALPAFIAWSLPVTQAAAVGVIESFLAPVLLLLLLMGSFALYARNNGFAAYHGAEHKVIKCNHAGKPLTIENVQAFSRDDVKCGTCFVVTLLFTAATISAAFFLALPQPDLLLRMAVRTISLFVAYAATFALFKATVNNESPAAQRLIHLISAPGLWLQRKINTAEPTNDQVQVAIQAMQNLLTLQ